MPMLLSVPWWVYLLFVFLTLVGLRSIRPRTLSLKRLCVLPLLFLLLNALWLSERLQIRSLLFWGGGMLVGSIIGWRMARNWRIVADRARRQLTLPGSWMTLILVFCIFFARAFFVYTDEVHPERIEHLVSADALVSGIITGIFIGRSLILYRKYQGDS